MRMMTRVNEMNGGDLDDVLAPLISVKKCHPEYWGITILNSLD